MFAGQLCIDSCQLGDTTGAVPIGDVNIGVLVDEAAMGSAEDCGRDLGGIDGVISPLLFVAIIAEEGDRNVVLIKNGHTAFQFRNYRVISIETDLAGTAQMLSYCPDELSIEVKVAETAVFAVTD